MRPLRHPRAPLRHSRAPLRHSCALSVIPAPPSVIPAPPPSFLRRQESRRAGWVRERRRCWTASAPSAPSLVARRGMEASGGLQQGHRSRLGAARVHAGETGSTHFGVAPMRPLRHSCSVIPAPPAWVRKRRRCAFLRQESRRAGWVRKRRRCWTASVRFLPVGGMEASRRSGGLQQGHRSRLGAARVHAGEIGSTHFGVAHACAPSVIPAPPPSFLRPLRHSCALSVIPAQAGIQASWVGSRTAPMLDGLR